MPKKWNSNIMFPSDSDYIIRIVKTVFGESNSSGNPMITATYEVVAPEVKEIAGEEVTLSGAKITNYYPTTVFDGQEADSVKTKASRERLTALYKMAGYEGEIDFENPDTTLLVGKAFYAQLYADPQAQRKEPTMAQVEAAKAKREKPLGDIMKHPVTQAELVSYWPKIKELFAGCPEHNSAAA